MQISERKYQSAKNRDGKIRNVEGFLCQVRFDPHRDPWLWRIAFCILIFDFLAILAGCKGRPVSEPVRQTEGRTPAPQMDTEPQSCVRVLLLDNVPDCTLKIAAPYTIIPGETASENLKFDPRMFLSGAGLPIIVRSTAGKITIDSLIFTTDQVTISPGPPQSPGGHIFTLNGDDYRGKLMLVVNPDSNSFDAINIVPLEAYLAGVVGAEMPRYWEPEALKAQAIAARTYCLYVKKRFGGSRTWDMRKTQAHQVYLGVKAESAQVWDAVNQTLSQVLVCRQADGSEDIFPAYYSSACGGHTENSSNVFGDYFDTLVGVPCPYCKDVAKPGFFFWPTVEFDSNNVTTKLSQRYPSLLQLGQIGDITATRQSNYEDFSRLTEVKLVGSTGKSDFLKAEDLRLAIDPSGSKIKSAICQIARLGDKWAFLSGRGFGHGVGMCQCGAQAMAREGKTAEQILSYYYRGSKIIKIY